jgi:hypothetical protein
MNETEHAADELDSKLVTAWHKAIHHHDKLKAESAAIAELQQIAAALENLN